MNQPTHRPVIHTALAPLAHRPDAAAVDVKYKRHGDEHTREAPEDALAGPDANAAVERRDATPRGNATAKQVRRNVLAATALAAYAWNVSTR
ncbi:hypothetical protein PG999_008280 [Apiospora kogelbergensis]|uniref:Uncharacterized protein n=1 Tax=Apiospora kogelbergensis TaxID=1337665 RepID=A0AAW0QID6_9PEZI